MTTTQQAPVMVRRLELSWPLALFSSATELELGASAEFNAVSGSGKNEIPVQIRIQKIQSRILCVINDWECDNTDVTEEAISLVQRGKNDTVWRSSLDYMSSAHTTRNKKQRERQRFIHQHQQAASSAISSSGSGNDFQEDTIDIDECEEDPEDSVTCLHDDQICLQKEPELCKNSTISKPSSSKNIVQSPNIGLPDLGTSRRCLVCGFIGADGPLLISHIKQRHIKHPDFKEMLLEAEKKHYQDVKRTSKKGIQMTCPFCSEERFDMHVFTHMRWCHDKEPNFIQLLKVTTENYELFKKKRTAVRDKYRKLAKDESRRETTNSEKDDGALDKKFKCQHCQKDFKTRFFLDYHVSYICKKGLRGPHDKTFKYRCRFCSAKYSDQLAMEQHMLTHKDPYQCESCGKQFLYKATFNIHRRRLHGLGKPIIMRKCAICNMECCGTSTYNNHMKTHSGIKSTPCEFCGKVFNSKQALQNHRQHIHLNEFRYRCDKCGHGLSNKSHINKHVCGRTRRWRRDQIVLDNKNVGASPSNSSIQ